MWIFTEDGFYSAVRETKGARRGDIVVRARSKQDLERFVSKYATETASPIHTTAAGEFRDYGYRIWMTDEDFAFALGRVALNIGYSNFKSRVVKTLGSAREGLLHDVWHVMSKVQPGGAFGVGGSSRRRRNWDADLDAELDRAEDDLDAHGDPDAFVQQRLTDAFDQGTVTQVNDYVRDGQQVKGYVTRRKRKGKKR